MGSLVIYEELGVWVFLRTTVMNSKDTAMIISRRPFPILLASQH